MRIKTLKRNTSNVIRRGRALRSRVLSHVDTNLSALLRLSKQVDRELSNLKHNRGPMVPPLCPVFFFFPYLAPHV